MEKLKAGIVTTSESEFLKYKRDNDWKYDEIKQVKVLRDIQIFDTLVLLRKSNNVTDFVINRAKELSTEVIDLSKEIYI